MSHDGHDLGTATEPSLFDSCIMILSRDDFDLSFSGKMIDGQDYWSSPVVQFSNRNTG